LSIRRRRPRLRSRTLRALSAVASLVAMSAVAVSSPTAARADAPPTPPFTQCPAIGQDTGCGLLIVVNSNGTTTVVGDSSQPPFDGIEDTLVGVQNNSAQPIQIIPISSSSATPIFDFDSDGICSGRYSGTPAGCPFGASGYEGPNTSFTVTDPNNGTLNFPRGLAAGASAYFSLEGAPSAGSIIIPRYVALGDSYSSGEGVSPFISPTDSSGNKCHRSMGAYPELIANRTAVPPSVEFWACSGATIRDFYTPLWGESPQLNELSGPTPTLVTVGVGGNDIGFDTIAIACTSVSEPIFGEQNTPSDTSPGYQADCPTYFEKTSKLQPDKLINGLTTGNTNAQDNVSYSVKTLYHDIRTNAPLSRVFVIGYPNPLPDPGAVTGDCQADVLRENGSNAGLALYNAQFLINQTNLNWMEKIFARLNSTIQTNALNAGFYFVDNSLTLTGHDICGNGKDHWVHGVVLQNQNNNPSEWSFHPNGKGQSAIANEVANAIAGPPAGGFVAKIAPGGFVQQFISVSPGEYRLIVQVAWPGSDVQLGLVSPSGVVYDRTSSAAGVIHQLQSNSESLSIPNPEPGQWTVRLYGANVAPAGEQVRVDASQIAQSAFAPVAHIMSSADRGVAPASLQFDGSTSTAYNGASVSSYSWDFGDGTAPVSGPSPTHVFTAAGSYTVRLTVSDTNGLQDSAVQPVFVTSTDQPPSANFIWASVDPANPSTLNLDASASTDVDGQITNYAWDFGDGTTGRGTRPAHSYAAAGTYPVTLTVTDNGGLSASLCQGVKTGAFSVGQMMPCTTTALTSDNNPAFIGQPVTLSAAVSPVAPSSGLPDGTVSFQDGGITLGTASLNSAGVTSLTTSTLTTGHHHIVAVYGGSSSFAPSRSGTLLQAVRENKIAFTSNRDGNFEIYVMKPDGSGPVRLTNNPALDINPALSPDGTRIAFVSTRSGSAQLWTMNADGTNPTPVTADPGQDASPAWSPDGKTIAYSSTRSGSLQIWALDTTQPLSSSNPRQVTANTFAGADTTPAWSPVAGQIAFTSTSSGSPQIWLMNADGSGTPTQVTHDAGLDATPAWSPDGSTIAFINLQRGSASINAIKPDGSGRTQLVNNPLNVDDPPSWSPDGRRVAYTTMVNGVFQIFEVDVTTLVSSQITAGAATNALPSWCCIQAP